MVELYRQWHGGKVGIAGAEEKKSRKFGILKESA